MNYIKIAKLLFKVMVLGFISLFVLESSARIDDWIKWDAPLFGNYSRSSLTLVDSLGIRNRPNSQFEKWVINSYGFRGEEIQKEAPESVIRIMVLGASEAFGLYEAAGKEFPAQLQELLNRRAPGRYEVINAAVPGLSPPQILHLYDRWLAQFNPDLVVYYPSYTGYLMHSPPKSVSFDGEHGIGRERFDLRIKVKTIAALKRFLPEVLQYHLKRILIIHTVSKHPDKWVFKSLPSGRVELFEQQLLELVDRVKLSDAKIVLSTHATRISNSISEYERLLLVGWRKLYPHVAENAFLEMEYKANNVIKNVAEKTEAEIVDIEDFIPKTNENFADHVHFTSQGARLAAELLEKKINSVLLSNKN